MPNTVEMRQERGKHIADARALLDTAETEKRDLSAEEREQYDKFYAASAALKDKIDIEEKLATEERELAQSAGRSADLERADAPNTPADDKPETREFKFDSGRSITLRGPTLQPEYEAAFRAHLVDGVESRALQIDSDTGGGYLSPVGFVAQLIQDLDNMVFVRQAANVLPALTTGASIGAPSLDNDPADPTWVTELTTGSEDSTMTFGKRELSPKPLAQFIKVSKTLLRQSAMSPDGIVRERLGYKDGVVQENAFLNGSGANQPLGIFTASDNGVTTSQDVSTGNTTTAITYDGLKEVKYDFASQYRRGLRWCFHRDAVKMISKLKDGDGRYIWVDSVTADDPDMLLGFPVDESEYAPNTFTTGLYVGGLCDWKQYWIVDSLSASIQVLTELYAVTNQNGYISRSECDGMPVSAAAFRRVTLA